MNSSLALAIALAWLAAKFKGGRGSLILCKQIPSPSNGLVCLIFGEAPFRYPDYIRAAERDSTLVVTASIARVW